MKKWTFYALLILIPAIMYGCKPEPEPTPEPEDATLAIDPTTATVNFTASADGEAYVYTVITNQTDWDAVSDKTWCKVAKNKTAGTFTITARENTASTSPTSAKVTVTAGDATPIIINATQDPGEGEEPVATVDTKFEIEGAPDITFTAKLSDETSHDFKVGATGKGTLKIEEDKFTAGLLIVSIKHPSNANDIAIGRQVGDNVAIKLKLNAGGVPQQREDGGKIKVNVVAELQTVGIPTGVDKECELDCDLYMEGTLFEPIASAAQPFMNSFDGKNKKLYDLTINHGTGDGTNRGLFACIGSKGVVKNVCVETGSVTGGAKTGAIVGHCSAGTISGCVNKASVTGTAGFVGGICGENIGGGMDNCWNAGEITNSLGENTGGIVGFRQGSSTVEGHLYVQNCRNTGNVTSTSGCVGGITGTNHGMPDDVDKRGNTRIEWCYNTGKISGTSSVGGVVGFAHGEVACSYNTGEVTGTGDGVGGVAGTASATVFGVYTTGKVTGTNPDKTGIIVGANSVLVHAFYLDISGNPAIVASEGSVVVGEIHPFGADFWPVLTGAAGDGDDGFEKKDWIDAGSWNGGVNPVFPKLKWE